MEDQILTSVHAGVPTVVKAPTNEHDQWWDEHKEELGELKDVLVDWGKCCNILGITVDTVSKRGNGGRPITMIATTSRIRTVGGSDTRVDICQPSLIFSIVESWGSKNNFDTNYSRTCENLKNNISNFSKQRPFRHGKCESGSSFFLGPPSETEFGMNH